MNYLLSLSPVAKEIMTGLILIAIFAVTVTVGYIIRKILFSRLSRWSEKTTTEIDDIIISATKGPFILLFIMLGIYIALSFSSLPEKTVYVLNKVLLGIGLFVAVLVAANISAGLIKHYSAKIQTFIPVTSLTQNIIRIIIFVIGILIILSSLGVHITPILATFGVGGLAVALALQDTLANLFAGFYITAARQIKVGDYIKLETGEEGYVIDINWRTTQIRMLPNNVVLIPNDKLLKSIVINYYQPDRELAVLVELGVHYTSDLEKVEKVTIEAAKEVMQQVPGGVPSFEPLVRYNTFGDFSIGFTVVMRAKEFADQYPIKHEFIKRLQKRYAKEGIVIPYPIRAINNDQEKSSPA